MDTQKVYTKHDLEIELLKNNQSYLFKTLDRIESNQKWLLGLMGTGFAALFGLISHGFKWII